ncbi:monooxygenase [Ophiocordyceps camponoti-floridani]|uniref:Monooxygenase n=1 Tax=Ophiocordyceps camponoti-floridani TaxID=2030778 RepID=A0A8H4Q9X3_9HYPO|nr:monooxygenase [Ophiocordyceps camponoti-floridani]
MVTKRCFLLGEDPSTAVDIELPDSTGIQEWQEDAAAQYGIVDPTGVDFICNNHKVTSTSMLKAFEEPIAIAIDGKPVRDVPGPDGVPFFGNTFDVFPDHLRRNQNFFEQYGPIFTQTNTGSQIYLTNDPKLCTIFSAESEFFTKDIIPGHPLFPIKDPHAGVFLGDTDTEEWRQAHKFMPPALGPKAVRHYAPAMQKCVESSFNVFDELDKRDEAWNVYPYMLKLGSQTIGKLVLGMDFNHFADPDSPLDELVRLIAESLALNKKIASVGSWYQHMPFGDPKKLRQTWARLNDLITQAVERASKGEENLELQDAALKSENVIDYLLRATDNKGNKLPKEQFLHTLTVATGAGFTTTSSLLSWLTFAIVRYPGVQDRLLQELVDAGWTLDKQVTADEVNSLPFLDNLMKETQRRHNPSYQPGRTAKTDMILPGGYKLPKGAIVINSIPHIHHNSKVWDEPYKFDPDRWDLEKTKKRPSGSYVPFMMGPRSCIGFNLALLEAKIFIAKLVFRYRYSELDAGTVQYDPYFQLIRPTNLYVRAERRVKWPPKTE